eukprot:gene5913-9743_t
MQEGFGELKKNFGSFSTLEYKTRMDLLDKLYNMVSENKEKIFSALDSDLKQTHLLKWNEVYSVLRDINYVKKNLQDWMKAEDIPCSNYTEDFFGRARVIKEPLGVVLIIGAWNYPFSLILRPLVGAIAAGNVAVIKPSELAEKSSELTKELISKYFDKGVVQCFTGGPDVTQELLKLNFDHIFFTGSTQVGRIIMKAAAEQLIPVTLELGGKSPCFIDVSVDLKIAAKRIVFGKFINCGQSCIAPDYVLIPSKLKEEFIKHVKEYIDEFYSKEIQKSSEYSRIINSRHFDRLSKILENEKDNIILGGNTDKNDLFIEPTLLDNIKFDSFCMKEEIFGPILPIIEYETGMDILEELRTKEKPLAFYTFSNRQTMIDYIQKTVSAGSMCVNDTISQYTKVELPFGGVGSSGIGKYHGKYSFDTFSHQKSVLENSPVADHSFRYPPFDENKTKWIERLDFSIPYQGLLVFTVPLIFYGISRYFKEEENSDE